MSRNNVRLIIVLAALALIYAIVLQVTGQSATAEKFVEWAGGGLATLTFFLWFFTGGRDD